MSFRSTSNCSGVAGRCHADKAGRCQSVLLLATGSGVTAVSVFFSVRSETDSMEIVHETPPMRHLSFFYYAQPDAQHSTGNDHLSERALANSWQRPCPSGSARFPHVGLACTGTRIHRSHVGRLCSLKVSSSSSVIRTTIMFVLSSESLRCYRAFSLFFFFVSLLSALLSLQFIFVLCFVFLLSSCFVLRFRFSFLCHIATCALCDVARAVLSLRVRHGCCCSLLTMQLVIRLDGT